MCICTHSCVYIHNAQVCSENQLEAEKRFRLELQKVEQVNSELIPSKPFTGTGNTSAAYWANHIDKAVTSRGQHDWSDRPH